MVRRVARVARGESRVAWATLLLASAAAAATQVLDHVFAAAFISLPVAGVLVIAVALWGRRIAAHVARIALVAALVVAGAAVGAADPLTVRDHLDLASEVVVPVVEPEPVPAPQTLPADCDPVLRESGPLAAALDRGWQVDCTGTPIDEYNAGRSGGLSALAYVRYDTRTIYFPPTFGSRDEALHVAAHEVGHTVDWDLLTEADRARFAGAVGLAAWRGVAYYERGNEVWAEAYARCVEPTVPSARDLYGDPWPPVDCSVVWAAL